MTQLPHFDSDNRFVPKGIPTRCPTDQKETQLGRGVVAGGGPNCVAGKLRPCHPLLGDKERVPNLEE